VVYLESLEAVMSYLRQISTPRLLALCSAVLVVAGAVAAIALAAGGSGPTPPPKPLAQAIRDAVNAPQVDGVTARIEFTNKLIDSASLQGSDPILSGAKGRLWAEGDRLRLELQASGQGGGGDAQVLVDGDRVTVIDQGSNTVYRGTLPAEKRDKPDKPDGPVTLARVQEALDRLMKSAVVSGAEPSNVAGRPAYTVKVSPRNDGGLLGSVQAAWDAANGVPLRAGVYAAGSSSPVLEVKATDIKFGNVPDGNLSVAVPAGAKVVDLAPGAGPEKGGRQGTEVTGVGAVSKQLSFPLAAPDDLVGLPRQEVRLIDHEGTKGALVTYGKGLGGIAVVETPAGATKPGGKRGEGPGLKLPSISINGASGQELDTALGTVVRFERGGVSYTVIGSVPPAAAEAAARAL
jgi:outer membrane lipoprotein-sorting protein